MGIRVAFLVGISVLLAGCVERDDPNLAYYNCGETPVKITYSPMGASMVIDGDAYTLIADEGGVYHTPSDADTPIVFTKDGEMGATLEIGEDARPICRQVQWKNSDDVPYYRAFGNEPGWLVELTPDHIQVKRGYDGNTQVFSRVLPRMLRKGRGYALTGNAGVLHITHAPKSAPCRDSMSGQYFADHVRFEYEGEVFEGCGDPAPYVEDARAALKNTEWVVEDINGRGIIDRSMMSVLFDDTGRISGNTGCNRYSAGYDLAGRAVRVDGLVATTRRACRGEAMQAQERKFLDMLAAIRRVGYQLDGGLVLSSAQGQVMLLRASD